MSLVLEVFFSHYKITLYDIFKSMVTYVCVLLAWGCFSCLRPGKAPVKGNLNVTAFNDFIQECTSKFCHYLKSLKQPKKINHIHPIHVMSCHTPSFLLCFLLYFTSSFSRCVESHKILHEPHKLLLQLKYHLKLAVRITHCTVVLYRFKIQNNTK